MRVLHPWALSLIPIVLICVVITLRRERALLRRSLLAAIARSLTTVALIAAIAVPFSEQQRPADALVAYLDISSSVTQQQGDDLLTKAREMARELGVPLSLVPFSKARPSLPIQSTGSESYSAIRSSWESLDTGATSLETALATQSASSAALLLSDGYETVGAARNYLSAPTTRIFPLTAPGESKDQDISITQLHAPLTTRAQKSVEIRAALTNSKVVPQEGLLEIFHGDKTLLSRRLKIAPNQDLSLSIHSDPAIEGLRTIQATFSWNDETGPHSTSRTIWLSAARRDRVLLLSGSSEDEKFLGQILKDETYQLDSVLPSQQQEIPDALQTYRAIVLNNISNEALPSVIKSGLSRYVRNGGGIIMVGGNESFGLGGYIGSSIEEILPVRLVKPRQEQKRLNVAVQLVIDKSRSMATDDRLEFAKAAAQEVLRNLKNDDLIGVMGFDEGPFKVLPVSPVSAVRDTAITRISRLFPSGATALYPALEEAELDLSSVPAGRKHIIVLTDGKLPDAGPKYLGTLKQLRMLGITVSTVMVGGDVDDGFLTQMAELGGGAFYQTSDPSNLPKIFMSDVRIAGGERTMKEEPSLTVRHGPDPIVSTMIRSFPNVRGLVQTERRESANTELVVSDQEGTYPLLASWKVGEGRSIAFTSDANGRWSSQWMRWDQIQAFWSDLIDSARPKKIGKESAIPFDIRSWVEGGEVVIDLTLFEDIGSSSVSASISTPGGATRSVSFTPVRRGHYQARLDRAMAGTYKTTVSIDDATLPEVAWTLSGELFGEVSHRKPNLSLLSEIALRTGGKLDPTPEDVRPYLKQIATRRPYSHELLVLALLFLFLEVGIRALPRR
jgi:Ca-activated chloride channel family protein